MKIKNLFIIFIMIILLPDFSQAQDPDEKVFLTVAGREVKTGEFLRMFNKSMDAESQTGIDLYLEQFINFKLKVAEAIEEGYDTTRAFREELNGYRNQLAQHYLTDTETKGRLLRKAYERSLNEVNAWHILVNCSPDDSPEDTLKAWKKATDIRERIIKGEPFEQVARSTSDDKSVTLNGGNLGYFSVFQMIMPFEDAVYAMKPGTISMPVRTSYGYHIIRLADKRPARGKVRVAHIMKAAPPGTDEKVVSQAEKEINNVYKMVLSGTPFSELAEKYSDHKESAVRGGELNWFGTGEIIGDFSEAAFTLKDTGDFTKPVRTIYGWHIIKLLDKKEPGSFEESRSFLESKINQSYLNSISKKSLVEKLKKEYNFRINQKAYSWFVQNTDTLVIRGLSGYDRTHLPSGNLYSFANQRFTCGEFARYIEKRGSMIITRDPEFFVKNSLETRVSDHIINYENSVLENKYPEFRYLMNEFHDGILLFEISNNKVWSSVQDDSAGLKIYYEANKKNYLTRREIEAKVYTLKIISGEKRLTSAYKKFSGKPDTDRRLNEKFNSDGDTLLVITEGKWMKGDDSEIDNIKWITGSQTLKKDGFPSLIIIKKVNEPVPLPLTEVQGEMISGYQDWLMDEWIKQLKVKYTVKIEKNVLDEIKRKISND